MMHIINSFKAGNHKVYWGENEVETFQFIWNNTERKMKRRFRSDGGSLEGKIATSEFLLPRQ